MNIQLRINNTQIFGVTEPMFEFTFMPSFNQDVQDRWMSMAQFIRRTLRDYYGFGEDTPHLFGVELYPVDEPRFHRQLTFGRISSIQEDAFLSVFDALLQSNEQLQLVGFRVTVQLLGNTMGQQYRGRGRSLGSKSIPHYLRDMGLMCHPKEHELESTLQELGLCGVLACLLIKDPGYQLVSRFHDWITKAQQMGDALGITNEGMRKEHFEMLVKLEGWEGWRIIVFSINRTIQSIAIGDKW